MKTFIIMFFYRIYADYLITDSCIIMKTLENENNRRHNNGSVPHREGMWPISDDIRFIHYVTGICVL